MSLAIDVVDQMIRDVLDETKDIPYNIKYIDEAIGSQLRLLNKVRHNIMYAEAKAIENGESSGTPKFSKDDLDRLCKCGEYIEGEDSCWNCGGGPECTDE